MNLNKVTMGKVKKNIKKTEDKPIDMSNDKEIEEKYENGGEMTCENCWQPFFITEGYSDEFCSKECADKAGSE